MAQNPNNPQGGGGHPSQRSTQPQHPAEGAVTRHGGSSGPEGGMPTAAAASRPPTDEEAQQEAEAGERAAERFGSTPVPYAENRAAASAGPLSDAEIEKHVEDARKAAEERDARAAVKRGAAEEAVQDYHSNVVWLMDNRADDRVVLHERDPLHPMGEVLFGGGVPRRAFLTPAVQHLLQTGELMPVPEPKRTVMLWDEDAQQQVEVPNPKYPDQNLPDPGVAWAAQPGRPIPLGRTYIDPDYFEDHEVRAIRSRQAGLPTYVPLDPGGTVPPEVAKENEEFMQRQRATGRSPRR